MRERDKPQFVLAPVHLSNLRHDLNSDEMQPTLQKNFLLNKDLFLFILLFLHKCTIQYLS